MDADDAVDLWENIDESVKVKLRPMIDDETKSAILLINSYDDSEVGSLITTNYICIKQNPDHSAGHARAGKAGR